MPGWFPGAGCRRKVRDRTCQATHILQRLRLIEEEPTWRKSYSFGWSSCGEPTGVSCGLTMDMTGERRLREEAEHMALRVNGQFALVSDQVNQSRFVGVRAIPVDIVVLQQRDVQMMSVA